MITNSQGTLSGFFILNYFFSNAKIYYLFSYFLVSKDWNQYTLILLKLAPLAAVNFG